MGQLPTTADVWRLYVKPALDGALITRKRTVRRVSAKVFERMAKFSDLMKGPGGAVVACRTKPWKQFISCLRDKAKALRTGTGPADIGIVEYRKRFWRHPA